jgi:hypothetical protein
MSTPEEDEPAASAIAVADTGTGAEIPAEASAGTETRADAEAAPGADSDAGPDADADADADAESPPEPERRSRWWVTWLIRLAWLAGLIAVGIGLFFCYLHVSRTARVASDGASNALQAWAMLHGNPMLRGWTVTDVGVASIWPSPAARGADRCPRRTRAARRDAGRSGPGPGCPAGLGG